MQLLSLSTILFLLYHIQNTCAQLETAFDLVIYFNITGINFPKDILFSLYTRDNRDKPQRLLVNNTQILKQSFFKSSRGTKFITHGWTASGKHESCILPMQAYLRHHDYNVIIVDWSSFSRRDYVSSASRVKAIGQYVAKMVEFLVSEGSDIKQMSLVGHSLGAHVMGLAGYELKDPKVGHVVGLDPGTGGFFFGGPGGRIHQTDADHVEIIHTDAGWLGLAYPIGDIDYWPNGGARQPGCGIDPVGLCAHCRAYFYFVEALEKPDSLYGIQCDYYFRFVAGLCKSNKVTPLPGAEPLPDKPKGNYMLVTRSSSPYGLGINGTTYRFL